MSKNIWYISKYFAPKTDNSPGGRGWLLLKELKEQGINSTVITSDSNNLIDPVSFQGLKKLELVDGINLVWLKTLKYGVAKSYRRIFSWFHFELNLFFLDKKKLPIPDAIVVSSLSLLSVLSGLWLKRKYRCRLIFEVRDIWPLTIIEEGGVSASNPMVKFLAWVERLGYKYSDAIIGSMPNLEAHVRSVSCCNTPVHCVPMGFSWEQLERYQNLSQGYVEKYLSYNQLKVVHAGTVGITNALEPFFEAAQLLEKDSSIQFILVGDGPLKEVYLNRYGHLRNLVFAPKVNKNQVPSVLSHCDIVYFSTFNSKVWEYGQSLNKLIDYMLSGKPVLASYSGYPSMINEAKCGFYIPSEDANALASKLKELSKIDAHKLNEIGERGRQWIISERCYKKLSIKFSDIVLGTEG